MAFGDSQARHLILAAARKRTSGTSNAAVEAFHLLKTGGGFDYVKPGWLIVNTTANPIKGTFAIKPIDIGGGVYDKILLEDDIFPNISENYEVWRPTRFVMRPPFGLEPEISITRWNPGGSSKASVHGVSLWSVNKLDPDALIENSTDADGLKVYGTDFHPMYHAALEWRNGNSQSAKILISGTDKSLGIGAQ